MQTPTEYFNNIENPAHKKELKKLWDATKKLIPDVEEGMTYGVPALKHNGKAVAAFASHKKHMGYYPLSSDVIEAVKADLGELEYAAGTVRFTVDKPIPLELVKKMVRLRLEEIGT